MGRLWVLTAATAAVSAALIVSGCKVDQQKEVATWRRVLNAPPATAPAPTLDPAQPLTLRQALKLANEHNENLALSGENYLQALIEKRRAADIFLPTADASASYNFSDQPGKTDPHSNTFTVTNGGVAHRMQVGVGEQLNLFNGFRDIANLRRAEYNAEQEKFLLLDLQQSILLDVATSYYQILQSEKSVDVLRYTIEVDRQRIADQEARYKQGMVRPLDVALTQSQAAADRVSLETEINNVNNGRAALALLLGVPVVNNPLADDLPIPGQLASLDELVRQAEQSRLDLRAAELAIEAARQSVKVAVGAYYPTLNLNLDQVLYRDPSSVAGWWSGGLGASLPIFSAGQIDASVRSAWSNFRKTAYSESLTRRTVLRDVRVAFDNLRSSQQRIEELNYEVDAARRAFEVSAKGYQVGVATNLERIAAQNSYLNSTLQLVQEQLNQKLLFLDLLRTTGRLSLDVPTSQPSTRPATTAPVDMPAPFTSTLTTQPTTQP